MIEKWISLLADAAIKEKRLNHAPARRNNNSVRVNQYSIASTTIITGTGKQSNGTSESV